MELFGACEQCLFLDMYVAASIGNRLAALNHCLPHPALHFCGTAFSAPRSTFKFALILSMGLLGRRSRAGVWLQWDGMGSGRMEWGGMGQDGMGQQSCRPPVLFIAGMLEGEAAE